MHQPYYRDDQSGEIVMPWVFLHAIKDYYDMLWYLERVPGIKATFNLVPSLLVQLKAYESFEVRDKLLIALRKKVDRLRDDERIYLAEYLFFANVERMIKPLPRYFSLYRKKMACESDEEASALFDDEEFLDLEVLFLLSWCGPYLRTHDPIVKTLLQKGERFTESEKISLLRQLGDFIKTIVPYYRKMMEKGRIEISTTPFNHPISPLLLDIKNAQKADPDIPLPDVKGNLADDAHEQIRRAIAYYTRCFGREPAGFWPAEGAVSYEFLDILADYGLEWAASDEEILYKTIKKDTKAAIYRRNRLHLKKRSLSLFFRDHALSDLIGFTYSGWEAESAVEDFVRRIETIHESGEENSQISVILDGENAWEYYPDNASHFFDLLYRRLAELPWCETATMSESAQDETIPEFELFSLEPGSWIGGNFDIWIGHPEKNRAWEWIYRTKADYQKCESRLDETKRKRILKEFLIAESSDWFWWYGDDHHTVQKETFDALFRKHLINIYHLMEQPPPQALFAPILTTKSGPKTPFLKEPVSRITPRIDGKITTFFEWMGAGEMDLPRELSAMNTEEFPIEKVLFGWDESYAYFAFVGTPDALSKNSWIELPLPDRTLHFDIDAKERRKTDDILYESGTIFELRIPKERVWDKAISFRLMRKEGILQQIPLYSKLTLKETDHLEKHWFV